MKTEKEMNKGIKTISLLWYEMFHYTDDEWIKNNPKKLISENTIRELLSKIHENSLGNKEVSDLIINFLKELDGGK